jgi:hypothetical protein
MLAGLLREQVLSTGVLTAALRPKVKDGVDAILESIRKVKDYELQGSNNPLLRAYIQYGVDTHKSKQASCDANEILIRSGYCDNPNPKRKDCKLDCVKGCTIVEIKHARAASSRRLR